MKRNIVICLMSICLTVVPLLFMAENKKDKPEEESKQMSWYIGFGFGYPGYVDKVQNDNRLRVDDLTHWTGNFKVGLRLNSKMLLGYDSTSYYLRPYDEFTSKFTGSDLEIKTHYLTFTYFPDEDGLIFRAGAGLASMTIQEPSNQNDFYGVGFLVGTGYAIKKGKYFHVTFNADFSRQYYISNLQGLKQANFAHAYIGFEWF